MPPTHSKKHSKLHYFMKLKSEEKKKVQEAIYDVIISFFPRIDLQIAFSIFLHPFRIEN
jgi:hypothetical protein